MSKCSFTTLSKMFPAVDAKELAGKGMRIQHKVDGVHYVSDIRAALQRQP